MQQKFMAALEEAGKFGRFGLYAHETKNFEQMIPMLRLSAKILGEKLNEFYRATSPKKE